MPRKELMVIDVTKGWSSHMPVLIKLCSMTEGTILEMGSGVYSTPFLHWFCSDRKRRLITYENDKDFIRLAREYKSRTHSIRLVDDYLSVSAVPGKDRYSIVFIDHAGHERGKTAVHFKDVADYVILHDSDKPHKNMYGLAFENFKYRKDYTQCVPWTTVLSNFHDLSDLW